MSDPNANPDALSNLANLILRGQQFQEIAVAEALRLCAGEWKEDRQRADLLRVFDAKTAAALAHLIAQNKVPSPWRDGGVRLLAFGEWLDALAAGERV